MVLALYFPSAKIPMRPSHLAEIPLFSLTKLQQCFKFNEAKGMHSPTSQKPGPIALYRIYIHWDELYQNDYNT